MSTLISRVTGNLTAAATWALVDATSFNNSETANTALTTSAVASSTFVPPAVALDGLAVKLASRVASPSGTMTVELFNVTGGSVARTVTVNVADLPLAAVADLQGGWIVFAFASITPNGTDTYSVRAFTSVAAQVNLFSLATTNWARALRTTTTGAPAAGDDMIVAGELTGAGTGNSFTVTMDQTAATDYGNNTTTPVTPALAVCKRGSLIWGVAASTNYLLQLSGHAIVYGGGTYQQGAIGSELPTSSTSTLQFDCTVSGDFGLIARNESICTIVDQPRTVGKAVSWTLLNADAAVNATSLTVVDDTGWLSGDVIAVASTIKPGANQNEFGTLNGNAGASSLTVNGFAGVAGGVAFSHLGGSTSASAQAVIMPDGSTVNCVMQAEVINMTRRAKVKAVTNAQTTFISSLPTAQVTLRWAEFTGFGANVAGKRGVECDTSSVGSLDVRFCSFHDSAFGGLWLANSTTDFYGANVSDNVYYKYCGSGASSPRAINIATARPNKDATYVVNRNVCIDSGGIIYNLADTSGTFTNNRAIGSSGPNMFGFLGSASVPQGKFDGNSGHSNNTTYGLKLDSQWPTFYLKSWRLWRNTYTQGEILPNQIASLLTCDDFLLWGNTYTFLSQNASNVVLRNSLVAADSGFTTTQGPWFDGGINTWLMENVYLSPSAALGGFLRPLLNDIVLGTGGTTPVGLRMIGRAVMMGGTAQISIPACLTADSYISIERLNNIAGNHQTWTGAGIITRDTTIFHTASPSMRMTPSSASIKLGLPILRGLKVPLANGAGKTVTVWVRKSAVGDGAAYNGAQQRLIMRSNAALGQYVDVVLATAAAAAGTWEQLTGSLPAPTDDGAYELYVDCDGTAGWVNIDDWAAA